MTTFAKPTQLFDFSLSDTRGDSWAAKRAYLQGCEVITAEAPAQLAAMVEQFEPGDSGWYVLLMEIPGFASHEWTHKGETLTAIVGQLTPQHARTWVYLLGGSHMAALVKVIAKTELVGFVQKVAAALSADEASPRARMVEVPAQKQLVKEYLAAQEAAAEQLKRQHQQAELLRRVAELDFDLPESLAAKRHQRVRPVVLLVEDDPTTLQVLKHLVSQVMPIDILAASNATDAAMLYRRNAPDMVFLDIGLPEVDGLTLLGKIRSADQAAHVVILTANAYRANLEQASQLGAKGFLAKPFTPAKIAEVVKKALKP